MALTLRNDSGQEVIWTSDNEKVATVTKDGTIIGVSAGEATITVKTADGKYSDSAKVQVKEIDAASLSYTWSITSWKDSVATSLVMKLTSKETERTIHLKKGTLHRVTVDGEQTSDEPVATDSADYYLNAGSEYRTSQLSCIDQADISATATYSYYMVWEYDVDLKEFTFTTPLYTPVLGN